MEQVRLQRTRHLFRDSREYEMVQRALKKMKGKTQTEVSGEMRVCTSTSSPCVMYKVPSCLISSQTDVEQ